jgi:nitroimidazol reductase NimA-like FMN-containing flavoprotein (pyridoxamine 5'-phosphate oxidase superfamily)
MSDEMDRATANAEVARHILDASCYVVLATADANGVPWASPVWYAMEGYRELYWLSHPGARHSRNIAARPRIALVVFDSTAAPNTGQAVYMSATAEQLTDQDRLLHGLDVYSRESERKGATEFGLDQVTGEARLRLYRASVDECWILDPDVPHDVRVGVRP